jgi:hypothetical protein
MGPDLLQSVTEDRDTTVERVSPEISPISPSLYTRAPQGQFESWTVRNSRWIAMAILVLALAIRIHYARACYLTPDEGLHFTEARVSSWYGAYKASQMSTHPPLLILAVHATMMFLGRSELAVRLPSLAGGTIALWLAFLWIRRKLGVLPALWGLLILAICPSAVSASTEVRQYGLLLLFLCGALYAADRSLEEESIGWAALEGLTLVCALLSQYIALLVIVSLGVYVLLRYLRGGVPRGVILSLLGGQLIAMGLFVAIYFRQIRHSDVYSAAARAYLTKGYYQAAKSTVPGFLWNGLLDTFSFLFGTVGKACGGFILALFTAGVIALLAGRTRASRVTGVFVVTPLVLGAIAGLLRVFPFGGTRHEAYLLPFLALGLAAVTVWMPSRLSAPLFLAAAFVSPLWIAHFEPDNSPRLSSLADMKAAVDAIDHSVPVGVPLFVDQQTRYVLRYYLGRDDRSLDNLSAARGNDESVRGHRIVSPASSLWAFGPNDVATEVQHMGEEVHAKRGQPLWVVSVAWASTKPLVDRLSAVEVHDVKAFGVISIFEIPKK